MRLFFFLLTYNLVLFILAAWPSVIFSAVDQWMTCSNLCLGFGSWVSERVMTSRFVRTALLDLNLWLSNSEHAANWWQCAKPTHLFKVMVSVNPIINVEMCFSTKNRESSKRKIPVLLTRSRTCARDWVYCDPVVGITSDRNWGIGARAFFRVSHRL